MAASSSRGEGPAPKGGKSGSVRAGSARVAKTSPSVRNDDVKLQLIEAAIRCILDLGYYRATSNEIARQAGVTWGSIQYHFRTREQLLIAVLEREFDRYIYELAHTSLTGETRQERLNALADFVWNWYGRREYLVTLQIHLNLQRDPKLEQATVRAMNRLRDAAESAWSGLFERTFGPGALDGHLEWFVFQVMRGKALGDAISQDGPPSVYRSAEDYLEARHMLVDMLYQYIESRPTEGSLGFSGTDAPAATVRR
jgi:AcrR family transcriptional regulator